MAALGDVVFTFSDTCIPYEESSVIIVVVSFYIIFRSLDLHRSAYKLCTSPVVTLASVCYHCYRR